MLFSIYYLQLGSNFFKLFFAVSTVVIGNVQPNRRELGEMNMRLKNHQVLLNSFHKAIKDIGTRLRGRQKTKKAMKFVTRISKYFVNKNMLKVARPVIFKCDFCEYLQICH